MLTTTTPSRANRWPRYQGLVAPGGEPAAVDPHEDREPHAAEVRGEDVEVEAVVAREHRLGDDRERPVGLRRGRSVPVASRTPPSGARARAARTDVSRTGRGRRGCRGTRTVPSFGCPTHPSSPGGRYRIHVGPLRLGSRSLRVRGWPGSVPAMSGRLPDGRILVVGAGTRPSPQPDAPVGNGRAIAILAARGRRCRVRRRGRRRRRGHGRPRAGRVADAAVAVGDVASAEDCTQLVDEAGALTGLVLNVGIGLGGGLVGTSPEQWDQVLSVNLRSHFLLAQAAVPRLPEGGSIVFVSSVAGLRPGSLLPAHDASKAGIRSVPSRRHGGRASGCASERGGARSDRHPARSGGHRGPAVSGEDPGAARPSGHGGRWRPRSCSCCRRRPATSPARPSPSTAA